MAEGGGFLGDVRYQAGNFVATVSGWLMQGGKVYDAVFRGTLSRYVRRGIDNVAGMGIQNSFAFACFLFVLSAYFGFRSGLYFYGKMKRVKKRMFESLFVLLCTLMLTNIVK